MRDQIEIFHFGHDRSLYGALHRTSADSAKADAAVLICSPIGQEHVRTHFILNRLGRQLASQGMPVLRFDYFGCADSLGNGIDASPKRWQHDIVDAYQELKHRTGARRVIGVGARLGATLLCGILHRIELKRLVLWDPVCDGAKFHSAAAEVHRRYVLGTQDMRLGRKPSRLHGAQELLGATYSDAAIDELKALELTLPRAQSPLPVEWLSTSEPATQRTAFQKISEGGTGRRFEQMKFDCAWNDITQMAEVLPDVGISKCLASMVRGVE